MFLLSRITGEAQHWQKFLRSLSQALDLFHTSLNAIYTETLFCKSQSMNKAEQS